MGPPVGAQCRQRRVPPRLHRAEIHRYRPGAGHRRDPHPCIVPHGLSADGRYAYIGADKKRRHDMANAPAQQTAETLPNWDLTDLYPGMDSPELAAELDGA